METTSLDISVELEISLPSWKYPITTSYIELPIWSYISLYPFFANLSKQISFFIEAEQFIYLFIYFLDCFSFLFFIIIIFLLYNIVLV